MPIRDVFSQELIKRGVLDEAGVPVAGGGGGVAAAISELLWRYESSRTNNLRTNAIIPSALITFGGTPASGVMGYANASVVSTGYTMSSPIASLVTNSVPNNGGATVPAPFRLYGAFPYNASGSNGLQASGFYSLAGARTQSANAKFSFVTDEPKPIIYCTGYSTIYCLNVNDGTGWKKVQDVSITPGLYINDAAFGGATAGGYQLVQLDFSQLGGRKIREFELVMTGDTSIYQIGITPASTYYDTAPEKAVVLFTDSLGGTGAATNAKDCYPAWVADMAGWRNTWLFSEGGTGFLATNGGLGRTHRQKIANSLLISQLSNVAVVVLQASVNDASSVVSDVASEAVLAINAALSAYPSALIIVGGPTAANNTANQTLMIAMDNGVAAAVSAVNNPRVLYFPTMADPNGQAIKGTGNAQAPASNGNADVYFNNTDGTHFNAKGHEYWGRGRYLPGIAYAMRKYVGGDV
jgi:lysophospholipase L1-like esterase